ncbi:hypothetical protein BN4901_2150 [Citrobacter europaeus]|uniref:Uncharacterized protein n=1 Tax=Citrobacter europaeus TaxID=1914243 RepID=A0ABY0JNM0_9ENTR|nr:hypothetical protein BN4901_2150 [Citrobacter europaeus]
MVGYCVENKEEKIIWEKTGIVFGLFLCGFYFNNLGHNV